ncbi:MAG: hypothetical protein IT170_18340 [Bryobacterales bacterium]|nr:hypothetical protein [Bryobacterales bacterium]
MPVPDSSADAILALPVPPDRGIEDCERQVRRILDSPLFSGSKRLSEFVAFSAHAAMEGRTEIDQYEVAAKVLNRADDFSPLDDASVRKLASQVRSKLEEYFQEQGADDPILVSLPKRSYVLRFRVNDAVAPSTPETLSTEESEIDIAEAQLNSPANLPAPVDAGADRPDKAQVRPEDSDREKTAGEGERRANEPLPTSDRVSRRTNPGGVWVAGMAILAMLAGAGIYQGILSLRPRFVADAPASVDESSGKFQIVTQTGDLRGAGGEFAPGAVLVGPKMDLDGDATVRMQFLPEHAGQHGGLMIAQDADNYVRFGSHFKVRSMLEFGHEMKGVYSMTESRFRFDPYGQSGLPLWLTIRKEGEKFTAFRSHDRQHWEPYESVQSLSQPLTHPVASLYAFNGLTENPHVTAQFRNFGVGLQFHHRPEGPIRAGEFPGWNTQAGCDESNLISVREQALEFRFPDDKICTNEFSRNWEAPSGEPWYVEVHIDFQALNGNSAGIVVKAEKGRVRLVRRDLNGASIMLERDLDRDVHVRDFPGAPPIFLRLTARDGYLTGSFSRDGEEYTEISTRIPLKELGQIRSYGLEAALSHWMQPGSRPPIRLLSIEHGLLALKPMKP